MSLEAIVEQPELVQKIKNLADKRSKEDKKEERQKPRNNESDQTAFTQREKKFVFPLRQGLERVQRRHIVGIFSTGSVSNKTCKTGIFTPTVTGLRAVAMLLTLTLAAWLPLAARKLTRSCKEAGEEKKRRHLCSFLVASVSELAFQVHCGKLKFQNVIQDGLASTASICFFAFESLNFMEGYQHISVVTH